jgi:predicted AAA+ superfamily ATPase
VAKQLGSIKKVYCIDNGLLNAVSFKFSEDRGRLLENGVYLELKRRKGMIYYHRQKYECDFILVQKSKVVAAIQVTLQVNDENKSREVGGLLEAMKVHNLTEGIILTEEQEQTEIVEDKSIKYLPVWKWLLW